MEKPPDNRNEEMLRPLPDSFLEAKYDYYFGKKDSPREFKWRVFCYMKMDPVSDLEKEQKNRLLQKIIGDGTPEEIQRFARACKSLESLEPYSGPNRSGAELEQELKHYVFTAVLMLQRLPLKKPFKRWEIEDIAQKLRAQEERRSRHESIAKDVLNLKEDEKKFLNEEVSRLDKEGKLEFTPRLWRETGLAGWDRA